MPRPLERTTRCTDVELITEVREGYSSLRVLAAVSGVPYATLLRVTSGKACTEAEVGQVRMAWAKYGPDAVYDALERVTGPLANGEVPHTGDVAELRALVHRLVVAVRG